MRAGSASGKFQNFAEASRWGIRGSLVENGSFFRERTTHLYTFVVDLTSGASINFREVPNFPEVEMRCPLRRVQISFKAKLRDMRAGSASGKFQNFAEASRWGIRGSLVENGSFFRERTTHLYTFVADLTSGASINFREVLNFPEVEMRCPLRRVQIPEVRDTRHPSPGT